MKEFFTYIFFYIYVVGYLECSVHEKSNCLSAYVAARKFPTRVLNPRGVVDGAKNYHNFLANYNYFFIDHATLIIHKIGSQYNVLLNLWIRIMKFSRKVYWILLFKLILKLFKWTALRSAGIVKRLPVSLDDLLSLGIRGKPLVTPGGNKSDRI